MQGKRQTASIIFILLAGICWGFMGLFVRPLSEKGLSSWDIVFLRSSLTAAFLAVFLLILDRKRFRIRIKDIWCFAGTGLLSIVFFNFCYFREITVTSLSVAAILLYTAPAFVMVISAVLFRERITLVKAAALVLSFTGLIFVTGVLGHGEKLTPEVILTGLGAGLGYALYSIFGRFAIDRGYDSYTISFYTFLFAGIATFFFADPARTARAATDSSWSIFFVFIFVMVSTVLPYLLYTKGLRKVDNSRASIIASVEPVAATLIGILVYGEKMTLETAAGIILVLSGIVLANLFTGKEKKS